MPRDGAADDREPWSGRPRRIVSGGQTGVDRAALDVAPALGLPCGGWCPAGRRAEDGVIPRRYPLRETPSANYAERTRRNVRDSDATAVLTFGVPKGGTALTCDVAQVSGKALLVVDLLRKDDPRLLRAWLDAVRPAVLNVAGPRESEHPGAYEAARRFLEAALSDAGD